ncbi:disulfide bond formation protein B [Caldimonas sp.]|uniref:disulfide bond formation protein B n=1 Tax=Caldimonas sp. TaxID=2838790 RepID=UPI00391BF943
MNRLTLNTALGAVIVLCLGGVAAALVSQYVFEMQPCPWCILQRVIFLAVALLAALALLLPARALRQALAGLGLALAASGIAAAVYQNRVAAQEFSCNLTLADRIISALGLESAVPFLFRISASCMDAAVDLLGLPYEAWSGLLFLVVGLVLLAGLRAR